MLFSMVRCPAEIMILFQTLVAMYFEDENLEEGEISYLLAFIKYISLYGDPRGRGIKSTTFSLILAWKLSMISRITEKEIDSEFSEEMFECAL